MNHLSLLLLALVACTSSSSSSDQPDAGPSGSATLLPYGATCVSSTQCQGDRCITLNAGGPGTCSRPCTLDVANDCNAEQAFCVPTSGGGNVCAGHIDTGHDGDAGVLKVGDSVVRSLTPLDDADLFLVHLDVTGKIMIRATPIAGVDLAIDIYNRLGMLVVTSNERGEGVPESATTTVATPDDWMFAVVRDVGTSSGGYTVAVEHTNM